MSKEAYRFFHPYLATLRPLRHHTTTSSPLPLNYISSPAP